MVTAVDIGQGVDMDTSNWLRFFCSDLERYLLPISSTSINQYKYAINIGEAVLVRKI